MGLLSRGRLRPRISHAALAILGEGCGGVGRGYWFVVSQGDLDSLEAAERLDAELRPDDELRRVSASEVL